MAATIGGMTAKLALRMVLHSVILVTPKVFTIINAFRLAQQELSISIKSAKPAALPANTYPAIPVTAATAIAIHAPALPLHAPGARAASS
jgi:hypothetical protein